MRGIMYLTEMVYKDVNGIMLLQYVCCRVPLTCNFLMSQTTVNYSSITLQCCPHARYNFTSTYESASLYNELHLIIVLSKHNRIILKYVHPQFYTLADLQLRLALESARMWCQREKSLPLSAST